MSLNKYYKPNDPTIDELMHQSNINTVTLNTDPNAAFPISQRKHPSYKKVKGWIIAIIAFLILVIPAYNIQKTNREGDYARARVILKTENWGKEWIHSQNGFKPIEEFFTIHVKMPSGNDLYPNSYTKPADLEVKDFSDQDNNAYTVLEVTEKWSPHYKQLVIKPEFTEDYLGSEAKTWISLKYDDFSRKNDFEQYGGFVCIYVAILFIGVATGVLSLNRRRQGSVLGNLFSTPYGNVFSELMDMPSFGGSSHSGGGRKF